MFPLEIVVIRSVFPRLFCPAFVKSLSMPPKREDIQVGEETWKAGARPTEYGSTEYGPVLFFADFGLGLQGGPKKNHKFEGGP